MNLSSTTRSEHFQVEFTPNQMMIRNLYWIFPLQCQKKAATLVLARSHSWIKLKKSSTDMYYWTIFFILDKLNSEIISTWKNQKVSTWKSSILPVISPNRSVNSLETKGPNSVFTAVFKSTLPISICLGIRTAALWSRPCNATCWSSTFFLEIVQYSLG